MIIEGLSPRGGAKHIPAGLLLSGFIIDPWVQGRNGEWTHVSAPARGYRLPDEVRRGAGPCFQDAQILKGRAAGGFNCAESPLLKHVKHR